MPPTHLEGRMELEEFADRPYFNTSSSGIHLCGHGVTFSTHVAEERITSPARLLLQLVEDGPVFFYNLFVSWARRTIAGLRGDGA